MSAAAVAARVRERMDAKGVTQADLATKFGRTQKWVSRRLLGRVDFTVADLEQVAAALDVPLVDLIFASD